MYAFKEAIDLRMIFGTGAVFTESISGSSAGEMTTVQNGELDASFPESQSKKAGSTKIAPYHDARQSTLSRPFRSASDAPSRLLCYLRAVEHLRLLWLAH